MPLLHSLIILLREKLGLLKMDFLGLRNLTVISDALENIVQNGKEAPDLDNISFKR